MHVFLARRLSSLHQIHKGVLVPPNARTTLCGRIFCVQSACEDTDEEARALKLLQWGSPPASHHAWFHKGCSSLGAGHCTKGLKAKRQALMPTGAQQLPLAFLM